MENEGDVLERRKADRVQKVQRVLPASSGRVQREGEMENGKWKMENEGGALCACTANMI